MDQPIPGFSLLVFERSIPESSPFLEERSRAVLPGEVSGKCPFEASAKGHGSARFLFPPAVEIAIAVAPGAAQILADLRMAEDHRRSFASCFASTVSHDSSSHSDCRRKSFEVLEGPAVQGDMSCPNDPTKVEQGLFIHLIPTEEFGVVAEIAQEPIQLPERSFGAIEPAGE